MTSLLDAIGLDPEVEPSLVALMKGYALPTLSRFVSVSLPALDQAEVQLGGIWLHAITPKGESLPETIAMTERISCSPTTTAHTEEAKRD